MKKTIAWILAVIITIVAVIYQKKTGPTYPKTINVTVNNNTYNLKLIRTNEQTDAEILLHIPDDVSGSISYKKYPTTDNWTTVAFKKKDSSIVAYLPVQPPAGKLEYYITLYKNDNVIYENSEEPIIIRFKGAVPLWVIIPHVLFMFIAMLLSSLTGLFVIFKQDTYKFWGILTLIFLFIGGSIFGPILQKFAFGEFWTGVPFGWDLTDNKTLLALLAWIFAVIVNLKKERPTISLVAAIILLVVYSIPHSLFGSQLDPNSGEVIQGFAQSVNIFIF